MRPILRGGHIWCHKSGITPISCVDALFLRGDTRRRPASYEFSDEAGEEGTCSPLPFLDQDDRWPQLPCGQVLIKFRRDTVVQPHKTTVKKLDFK